MNSDLFFRERGDSYLWSCDQGRYLVAGTAGDQVEEEGNYQEFLSQEIKLRGRFRGEPRNSQS